MKSGWQTFVDANEGGDQDGESEFVAEEGQPGVCLKLFCPVTKRNITRAPAIALDSTREKSRCRMKVTNRDAGHETKSAIQVRHEPDVTVRRCLRWTIRFGPQCIEPAAAILHCRTAMVFVRYRLFTSS